MSELALSPIDPPDCSVHVPGSKSYTNRALICAALASGPSRLRGWLDAEDTEAMIGALGRLGVGIAPDADGDLIVRGVGGDFAIPLHPIDCRASGTTLRFLTACAALVPGRVVLDGTARMRERPVQDLADALSALGVPVRTSAGYPPITINGGSIPGGEVAIDAGKSSQYLSALLMAAPMAENDVTLIAVGLTSRPYVDLTLETMSDFGVHVEVRGDDTFHVAGGQRYRARSYSVEPDASAATYFLAAAAVTAGRVRVDGLTTASLQSDARFVEVLERMGCTVERGSTWISVRGPRYLHGIDIDLNAMPDSALTLAVVALYARGRTAIRNVPNLRLKETDRLAALQTELRKLGATVETTAGDLIIDPPSAIRPAKIATYDDHRMAMSFAVAGLVTEGIVIENPDCVAKTFPDFFDRLKVLAG